MNNEVSITALMSSFGRAFHAENEDHPVFADHLAKELMTAEEYAAVLTGTKQYVMLGAGLDTFVKIDAYSDSHAAAHLAADRLHKCRAASGTYRPQRGGR